MLKESTARELIQMLAEWKSSFPRQRPRQRRRSAAGGGGGVVVNVADLFQVESPATGPGIYNCRPLVIDSSEWNIAGGGDILIVKVPTETEEVLNIEESGGALNAELPVGSILLVFKVVDDEGNTRLVGRAVGQNFINQFFEVCT